MNGWFNPDSWMDVLDHLLLVMGVLLTVTVPTIISARSNKNIREVKEQVTNGHTSPMRLDLDRVLNRLEEMSVFILEVQRGVSGLRAELLDEEGLRRESVREVRSNMERNRNEIKAGMSHIEGRLNELEKQIHTNE